jgi:hypothetical protein
MHLLPSRTLHRACARLPLRFSMHTHTSPMCNPLQLVATRVLQRSLSPLHSPLSTLLRSPTHLSYPVGARHPYQKKRNESKGKQKTRSPPFHHLISVFASYGPHTLSLPPLPACLPTWVDTYLLCLPRRSGQIRSRAPVLLRELLLRATT